MSSFIVCEPPREIRCPPTFALRVSGWINEQNNGDPTPGLAMPPPAGMRLRWNCPFLASDPVGRVGYPTRFKVLRTGDLSEIALVSRRPNAGHIPRTLAPPQLWHDVRLTGNTARVGPGECDQADAVYFEMRAGADPVEAMLVDVTGSHSIAVEMRPGDKFYYEMASLHAVHFSARPSLVAPVQFLNLRANLEDFEFGRHTIATVDARAWINAPLASASERFSNPLGDAYVSLGEADWDALRIKGDKVARAHDANDVVNGADLDVLAIAAASRWEAAILMGWGFLDGEHPGGPALDQIDFASMLTAGAAGIYGYQVIAEFDGAGGAAPRSIGSSLQFVSPNLLDALTAPALRATSVPRAVVQTTNLIAPGPAADQPKVGGQPVDKVFCRSSYLFATSNRENERILVRPMASGSVLSGETFTPFGAFEHGAGDPAVRVVGMERRISRGYDYKVPFVDSTVWLDVTVQDSWDRRLHLGPTPAQGLELDYEGVAPPLSKVVCDSSDGLVETTLDSAPPWRADIVARLARGRVETLARNPATTRLEVAANVGPPFLQPGQTWGAVIDPAPDAAGRDKLVGGIFSVDGFNALITGFTTTAGGQLVCEFQANAQCAGENLYAPGAHGCLLREAEAAPRLWTVLSDVRLDAHGQPLVTTQTTPISTFVRPTTSTTFYFSTRMTVEVNGQIYHGPLSTPVATPYIHPAPTPPNFCIQVQQLGTDYYGRALVKAAPEGCELFSENLQVSVVGTEGRPASPSNMSQIRGAFQPQYAFQQRSVFEALEGLARTPEDEPFTFGFAYVRASDGASSEPELKSIRARIVGD